MGFTDKPLRKENFYERHIDEWVRLSFRGGLVEEGCLVKYSREAHTATLQPYIEITYPNLQLKRCIVDREMEIDLSGVDSREVTTRENIEDKCKYINHHQNRQNILTKLDLRQKMSCQKRDEKNNKGN
jgi:hypothetical protein